MTSILAQIQARQNLTIVNDFGALDLFNSTMEERITEFKEDPLVLACVLKAYTTSGKGYLSLDSNELTGLITDSDRQQAEEIREYYTKKFFWKALADACQLSDYRRRLINLLENRIAKCKDQDCGIYYKLPYFYEEDVVYEEFKKKLKTTEISHLGSAGHNTMTKRLEFLTTTLSAQRKRKIVRYWFKDDNEFLYGLELASDNPLLMIFNDYLNEHPEVVFETRLTEDRIDQMNYYKLYNFKFIKEQNA